MSLCATFSNQTECVLELSNIVQMKVLTLGLLIILFLVAVYLSDSFDPKDGMFSQWMHHLMNKLPPIFIVLTPLMTLFLLKHSISYESFVLIIASIYLIGSALFIGLSVMYGSLSIWKVVGYDDKDAFKEAMKYEKTNKKHSGAGYK